MSSKMMRRLRSRLSSYSSDHANQSSANRAENMDSMHATEHTNGIQQQSPPEPEHLSRLDEMVKGIHDSMHNVTEIFTAVQAPLPTQTGDGSILPQEHKRTLGADIDSIFKDASQWGWGTKEKLVEAAEQMALGNPLDDRKYFQETLTAAAAIHPDEFVSDKITSAFITTLWNDIPHPPQTLLDERSQYRMPDGSYNSHQRPDIGKAGMPYARTVTPQTMQPGALPDPGVLFDTLMARDKPELHPNRISSMLFYIASIIIHDVFRTDHRDFRKSATSSYLDLAPLYGSTWDEQKRMRTFTNGKIKPDCFSETRLLSFPPGVGAILIMFNRYHNYVVEQLALINEGGRFTDKGLKVKRYTTSKGVEDEIDKRDDDLFQTGRLVTCGLYVNVILVDYVRTILNLNRTDSDWCLDPRKDIPNGPPRGTGNQVSAEFNLVYRWHSAISTRDEKFTDELAEKLWGSIPTSDGQGPSQAEILKVLMEEEKKLVHTEPEDRLFPALRPIERIKDGPYKGNFSDDDLADILTSSIDDCANAMGPRSVPIVMRAIEILGIQQARTWQLATLNEFRKHFGLEPHQTFDHITKNPEVAATLKHLYNTPDNVELYPGLVVEDAKEPMLPGSGLCPSFTVSRGVLSDAVALVRGDRFYTTAYSPALMTNWGYTEASSDVTIDNGCVLYKLFLRALPNNYDPASVYVHYPLTIPSEMRNVLQRLNKDHRYNFDKPKAAGKPPVVIFSYEACKKVTEDQETFKVAWTKAMEFLMGPKANTFMLAGDGKPNAENRKVMEKALYLGGGSSRAAPTGNEKWLQSVKTYYHDITVKLLEQKSFQLGTFKQADMIRDVGNMAHVHFAAELFSLPLKTDDFKHGLFTEQQLYMIFAAEFICIFFDLDPPKSFSLRQQSYDATQKLGQFMQALVSSVRYGGKIAEDLVNKIRPTDSKLKDYGIHMIAQLCKSVPDVDDLVWAHLMGTAGAMVANQGQLFAQVLDYLFTAEGQDYLPVLKDLAEKNTPEADSTLMHYFMEFSRLNGEAGVFRYATKDTTLTDGSKTHSLQTGDEVIVNLKAASRDPAAFPNPDTVDPTRPLDSYIHFGHGPHRCLGEPMCRVALTEMLKVVVQLPNLRPAKVAVTSKGDSQESFVKKVVKEFVPGDLEYLPESMHYHAYLTEEWDMYFPFPQSLKLNWDAPAKRPLANGTHV